MDDKISSEGGKGSVPFNESSSAIMPKSDAELSGRELDAAVAERVMGWRRPEPITKPLEFDHLPIRRNGWTWIDKRGEWIPLSNYSTDIAAAMQVVTRFSDTPHNNRISNHIGLATISIHQYPDGSWLTHFVGKGRAQATTLPEAICRAALAAVAHT